jgi:putative endonuclease
MSKIRASLGIAAEAAVGRRLEQLGFRILDRNWRRPWGELDLVVQKNGVVHFVEVKAARMRQEGFDPSVRAGWRKMAKVRRTARTWLVARHMDHETPWQMDVAAVIMAGERLEIEIFENI